jgi:hypothetical protein
LREIARGEMSNHAALARILLLSLKLNRKILATGHLPCDFNSLDAGGATQR